MKQSTWLRIIHSGDWCLLLVLCTPSGACWKRRRKTSAFATVWSQFALVTWYDTSWYLQLFYNLVMSLGDLKSSDFCFAVIMSNRLCYTVKLCGSSDVVHFELFSTCIFCWDCAGYTFSYIPEYYSPRAGPRRAHIKLMSDLFALQVRSSAP